MKIKTITKTITSVLVSPKCSICECTNKPLIDGICTVCKDEIALEHVYTDYLDDMRYEFMQEMEAEYEG